MSIILGIDPGSRVTGYGVIRFTGKQYTYLDCGCLRLPMQSQAEKLREIFAGIQRVIVEYQPQQVAIEEVFMHQNAGGALKLGQARGAAMVAAAERDLPVAEYSARQIKQAVVGYGAASKQQVQHMVRLLLNLNQHPAADAADALAVAVCHANMHTGLSKLGAGQRLRQGRIR